MKNIIKISFLLLLLIVVFGCPKKDTTTPPESYNNNIDVRFAGSWDSYSLNQDEEGVYQPVLMQQNYLVASSDSLLINSQLIGGNENHGVFFANSQIGYQDKDDNMVYLYDYFYNKDLGRIWLKADTLGTVQFDYDPLNELPDSTVSVNDFILLYPSNQGPMPALVNPLDNSEIGTLKPTLQWTSFNGATKYCVQVTKDSIITENTVFAINDTVTSTNLHINNPLDNFSKYYWRVKANNSVWSQLYSFSTFYIVSLNSPSVGESTTRKPLLKWDNYDGANNYELQISLTPDFTTLEYDITNLEQNQYLMPELLQAMKRYYWRVKADNSEGYWSLTGSFITDAFVTLQSPVNGHTGEQVSSIEFNWQALDNASTYHIQIADSLTEDNDLVNIIVDQNDLTTTSYVSQNELEINKTYYWRVTSDVAGKWSYVFNFVTNTTVFLRNPENNSVNVPVIINFQWDKLSEADTLYYIQIADNADFENTFEDTTSHTSKVIDSFIESQTQYYWRIKANEDGEWSNPWTFTTMNVINGTNPNLPPNGATGIYQKPTFGWDIVAQAAYYQIMVSRNESFTDLIVDTYVTSESYEMTDALIFGTTYYWKVRSDKSLWSEVNSFTVETGTPENLEVVSTSPLKFDLKWNNRAINPIGYILERWDSETDEWSVIADTTKLKKNDVSEFADFDKDPNLYYKYRLKAVSETCESEYAVYPEEGNGIQVMPIGNINMPEMISVEPGTFEMGSTAGDSDEEPLHNVTLTHNFQMSKYEISIAQFVDVMNVALGKGYIKPDTQYHGNFYSRTFYNYASNAVGIGNLFLDSVPLDFDVDTHKFICADADANKPIYDITFFAAALYSEILNEMQGNDSFYNITNSMIMTTPYAGEGFRLPTEAEWEYTAKYNDNRTYPWGNSDPDKDHANYYGSGWGNEPINIDACAQGANALGIYNMAGNVWEWCNDTFEEYTADDVTDPTGAAGNTGLNTYKIIRGGSCELGPNYLRTANRSYCKSNLMAGKVNSMIGFRVVKILP